MHDLELLLTIAEESNFQRLLLTTARFAALLKVSQQTVSNRLQRLEKEGYIERNPGAGGTEVQLTPVGRNTLKRYNDRLAKVLSIPGKLIGTLFSGFNEGRFYVSQERFVRQFIDSLSIEPYPGTLNLRVEPGERAGFFADATPIKIKGFRTKERSFGGLDCYRVLANGVSAAVVVPERGHYKADVIELISRENLRMRLKLKDKDKVIVTWP